MRTALRQGFLFSLLLALAIPLASCDSGGSSGGGPEWTGNWEVVSFDEGGAPETPNYWDLSESELRIFIDSAGTDTQCIDRADFEVTERDGNIVSFLASAQEVEPQTVEFRFEVSGETMTATILESSDEEGVGDELMLEKIEDIPVNPDNCDTDPPESASVRGLETESRKTQTVHTFR